MATKGEITHHKIRIGKFCLEYEVGNSVPVITDSDSVFVDRREITPEEAEKVWRAGIESSEGKFTIKPQTVIRENEMKYKRYMVFAYADYYPSGGLGDVVGSFYGAEEAIAFANGQYNDDVYVFDRIEGAEIYVKNT